jgi:hypothetical protein
MENHDPYAVLYQQNRTGIRKPVIVIFNVLNEEQVNGVYLAIYRGLWPCWCSGSEEVGNWRRRRVPHLLEAINLPDLWQAHKL